MLIRFLTVNVNLQVILLVVAALLLTGCSTRDERQEATGEQLPSFLYLTEDKGQTSAIEGSVGQFDVPLKMLTLSGRLGTYKHHQGSLILGLHSGRTAVQAKTPFNADLYSYVDIEAAALSSIKNSQEESAKTARQRREKLTVKFLWKREGDAFFSQFQSLVQDLVSPPESKQVIRFVLAEHPAWNGEVMEIRLVFLSGRQEIHIHSLSFSPESQQSDHPLWNSRLKCGSETRPAKLLAFPSSLTMKSSVRDSSVLHFGASLAGKTAIDEAVTLTLQACKTGEPDNTIGSWEFVVRGQQPKTAVWQDYSLPLGTLGARHLTLTLATTTGSDQEIKGNKFFVAISQPYLASPSTASPGNRSNVMLVSLDTLRADHLGCYGYPVHTSPYLDLISRKGTQFARAFTPYPSTAPAHVSLLTGLYPFQHTVLKGKMRLPFSTPTLAEKLSNHGFFTQAITGGGNVSAYHRIDKGFAAYEEGDRSVRSLKNKALPWLKKNRELPFFLFYHTYEIHAPFPRHNIYTEHFHPDYDGKIDGYEMIDKKRKLDLKPHDLHYLIALYDSGIRFTDKHLGNLLSVLKSLDLNRNTDVYIVSDHGEHFSENGIFGHGNSLYGTLINVPLLVLPAENRSRQHTVSDYPANLIDLPATICARLNLAPPRGNVGQDLSIQTKSHTARQTETFSELRTRTQDRKNWIDAFAIIRDQFKLILTLPEGSKKLFHLASRELDDDLLNDKNPDLARELEETLHSMLSDNPSESASEEGEAHIDESAERLLKALGYLE